MHIAAVIVWLALIGLAGWSDSSGFRLRGRQAAMTDRATARVDAVRERRRAVGSRAQDDIPSRMKTWATALGVTCVHCHVPDAWSDSSKPTFEFAQRMMRMVNGLNAGPMKELGGVTCWTCHRGQTIPAKLPRAQWEEIQRRHSAEFASNPGRALAMSVYSASLGVDCMHCHEPETWASSSKRPFTMVRQMLPIFDETPKHFDKARMPQTQCYMCHQGKAKPER